MLQTLVAGSASITGSLAPVLQRLAGTAWTRAYGSSGDQLDPAPTQAQQQVRFDECRLYLYSTPSQTADKAAICMAWWSPQNALLCAYTGLNCFGCS